MLASKGRFMGSGDDSKRKRAATLRRPKRPDKAPKRGRSDWIEAARCVLIERGIERVKVEPLAQLLGVTTGSFYHHFEDRQELLDELLEHWRTTNSAPMAEAVERAGPDPMAQFDALTDVWIKEQAYNPAYDTAVRAWAHSSEKVRLSVIEVDDSRIDLIKSIFLAFGYANLEAFVRARIAYFHQVGYQAMEISETPERRQELLHFYRQALIGPRGS
jgi:AcrR family transcriptional regulator